MPAIPICLVLVLDTTEEQRQVLLGLEHTGIGATRVVGLGGHVDPGETAPGAAVREAAVREANEEAGIVLSSDNLDFTGRVRFRFPDQASWDQDVDVFTTSMWAGDLVPSDEISPAWYDVKSMPFDDMWDDAQYWLLLVLLGGQVDLTITFHSDNRTVHSIT